MLCISVLHFFSIWQATCNQAMIKSKSQPAFKKTPVKRVVSGSVPEDSNMHPTLGEEVEDDRAPLLSKIVFTWLIILVTYCVIIRYLSKGCKSLINTSFLSVCSCFYTVKTYLWTILQLLWYLILLLLKEMYNRIYLLSSCIFAKEFSCNYNLWIFLFFYYFIWLIFKIEIWINMEQEFRALCIYM